MSGRTSERIKSIVEGSAIVLFMKSIPAVVKVLDGFGAKYDSLNLSDSGIEKVGA